MKTKHFLPLLTITTCFIIGFLSCEKDIQSSRKTLDLSDEYSYMNTSRPLGNLGRVLFYDQSLSINNSVSCGTCHKQAFAFTDQQKVSSGFQGLTGERNTPGIQNLFAASEFFWDGREKDLKTMVMRPFFNHVEMGMSNTSDITNRVKEKPYYKDLFIKAFGDDEITFDRIAEALGGFVGAITSLNSEFDSKINGIFIASPTFSPNVDFDDPLKQKGLELFFDTYDCGSCHNLTSASGYDTIMNLGLVNIGLDAVYKDKGLGELTGRSEDNGKFKIPNLRNVELTAPYMHDGRFATLEAAIDHYNGGIRNHPNLDHRLKENGQAKFFNIPDEDKKALVAFLKTLTDYSLISDPKYSDPFKNN